MYRLLMAMQFRAGRRSETVRLGIKRVLLADLGM